MHASRPAGTCNTRTRARMAYRDSNSRLRTGVHVSAARVPVICERATCMHVSRQAKHVVRTARLDRSISSRGTYTYRPAGHIISLLDPSIEDIYR